MIKLALFLTLIPSLLFGQSMSGSIGVITISDEYGNTDHVIELLNEDGTTWYTLNLYEEWENIKPEFKILAFKPDYFLFKIKCKERTSTGYKVVVNEETGLTKMLIDSKKVKLLTWEQYVTDVFSVDFNTSKHPIYDKINGTPISRPPKNESIMVPKEIVGDWMRIIWSETDEYPTNTDQVLNGWIRWRKNGRMLITVYHLS